MVNFEKLLRYIIQQYYLDRECPDVSEDDLNKLSEEELKQLLDLEDEVANYLEWVGKKPYHGENIVYSKCLSNGSVIEVVEELIGHKKRDDLVIDKKTNFWRGKIVFNEYVDLHTHKPENINITDFFQGHYGELTKTWINSDNPNVLHFLGGNELEISC